MGENSAIAWTNHTFNPWEGCTKVSPGCANCYAEARNVRFGDGKNWGKGAPRRRTVPSNWAKPLRWNREALASGTRPRVFCASLADVFDDEVEPKWRDELWTLVAKCSALDWLLLTKRPQNFATMLPWSPGYAGPEGQRTANPWGNVWLGTTVENEKMMRERLGYLISTPAAVRFLSMEPLLEYVSPYEFHVAAVDWIIVGGESGPKARSFHLDWARSYVEWGREISTPIFVKQMGDNAVGSGRDQLALLEMKAHHRADPAEWPADLRVQEFPTPRSFK